MKHKIYLSLIFLMMSIMAFGQNIRLSGTVSDDSGLPLIGVNVVIVGTTQGAVTNLDGQYTVYLPSKGTQVKFSYMGYKDVLVTSDGGVRNVTMEEESQLLESVVVIGYGSVQKKDITTSVATVSPDELANKPLFSVGEGLQGKAAGVQVVLPTGKPGAKPSIRVRGATSVLASNEPLYVVDGVPTTDLGIVNSTDVESIQILKDASSAAIYGARAANGVVIVTTKKGKKGSPRVHMGAYFGVSQVSKRIEALNTTEYLQLLDDMNIAIPAGVDRDINTNWFDETFEIGFKQNYELSVSGGSDNSSYYISGDYISDKGILSAAECDKFSLRTNLNSEVRPWLNLSASMNYIHSTSKDVPDNKGSDKGGVIMSIMNTPPFMPIWNPDKPGQYASNPFSGTFENPLATLSSENNGKWNQFVGNVSAEFKPFKGFSFKTSFAVDVSSSEWDSYTDNIKTGWGRQNNGLASSGKYNNYTWLNENVLNYEFSIKNQHNFKVLLGNSNNANTYSQTYASGSDFLNNSIIHTVNGANYLTDGGSSKSEWAIASFFGRIMYDFEHKYLFTANIRYDGSSKLAKGNKWGAFPSFSAGWRVSEESFFKDNVKFVDDLKIRAGWGKNGNQEGIGNYAWYGKHYIQRVPKTDPLSGPALVRYSLENRDLTWETTTQANIGIDLSIFNNRVVLNLDAYYKKTKDLLLNVPLPSSTGVGSLTKNDGEITNKGIELNLVTRNFVGDFTWDTEFNISHNKNTIDKLGLSKSYSFGWIPANNESVIQMEEGLSLGTFYGYKSLGVNPETGMMDYADMNENGYIDPDDRVVIGCAQPKVIYGMTNNFSYKNFSLSVFLQGSQGNDVYNASRIDTEGMFDFRNQSKDVLNRWETPGDITYIPKASSDGNMYNVHNSSRFVEDGSYLKLKSLTLAYDLPKKLLNKVSMSRCQVYFTGYNLLTLTKYTGYDPELNTFGNSGVELGVDFGTYPPSRSFVFGINVDF